MSLRIIVTFVPLLKPEVYVTFPSAELTSVHCFVSIVSFVCVLLPPINKTDETLPPAAYEETGAKWLSQEYTL